MPKTESPLRDIAASLSRSETFTSLLEWVNDGRTLPTCGQAAGSSKALLLSEIVRQTRKNVLVVTPEQSDAYLFLDDIEFFCAAQKKPPKRFVFPHLEILPYESQVPELTIRMERLAPIQHRLESGKTNDGNPMIVVAPVAAAFKKLPPLPFYDSQCLRCKTGSELSREFISEWLVSQGYEYRDLVAQRGDFSARGDIVDIFSYSYPEPVRIELWGDEIESIRLFEVSTQRSIQTIDEAVFYPGNEEALLNKALETNTPLEALWSLLGDDTLLVWIEPDEIEREGRSFHMLAERRYQDVTREDREDHELRLSEEDFHKHQTVLLEPPETLYFNYDEFEIESDGLYKLSITEFAIEESENAVNLGCTDPELFGDDRAERIKGLVRFCEAGKQVYIVCDNEGQKSRLDEIVKEQSSPGSDRIPRMLIGAMHRGFTLIPQNVLFCTDREIFGRYNRFRTPARDGIAIPLDDLVDLQPGDFVVHIDHGIGRFVGLRRMEMDGKEGEYLELRYAENGILYVPIDQVDRVGRYIGGDSIEPTLSKLGTKNWDRAKSRAKAAIEDMAEELLDLYATRSVQKGHSYAEDTSWQHEFEASFLYEETADQWRAIEEVKRDMENDEPMDRLICGDVGFGKTEVAIRAAFKAVMDGKQVAVLVPTTILCQQHYNTFRERLADYPMRVEMLSRFQSPGEQKKIVEALNKGEVEITVGTHRLISKDVKFADLGLLIIDEEQRFGVKHKERLRQMRKTVDTLILSATPIPRTMYMSLSGIRDMSLVSTPPKNRHPIETYIMEWSREVIENAVLRELSRDGQVYFVHNKVESIMHIANLLQEWLPDARICVGHGQMDNTQLERVMERFIRHEYDILVATTIVENGLDIPNVNTIVINQANHFGLSQLYQLRGRVGRDRHRAYCYLLVPSKQALSSIARRRLLALQQHNQLGAGFHLAMQDMEIRGIGNILGREQHGYMVSIGFDLYSKLLNTTISGLRGKKGLSQQWETVLEFSPKGTIPPTYVESSKQRMALHQRIAKIKTYEEIDNLRDELQDIYGKYPKEVERLLFGLRIRVRAHEAGMQVVHAGRNRGHFIYHASQTDRFNPLRIIQMNGWEALKFQVETKGESVVVKFEDTKKRGTIDQRIIDIIDEFERDPDSAPPLPKEEIETSSKKPKTKRLSKRVRRVIVK